MEEKLVTAIEKIKEHCTLRAKEVDRAIADGSVNFARYDQRITYLEDKYDRMCIKLDVINSRVSYVLGGVAVACILLAVNFAIRGF